MIDEDSSQTIVKSLCPPFFIFLLCYFLHRAMIWQVIDVFYVGIAFHPLTNVFNFFMYLAAAPYDISVLSDTNSEIQLRNVMRTRHSWWNMSSLWPKSNSDNWDFLKASRGEESRCQYTSYMLKYNKTHIHIVVFIWTPVCVYW